MYKTKQYMPEGRFIIRKTQYRDNWYFQVVDTLWEIKFGGIRAMQKGSEPPAWMQAKVAELNSTHQPLQRRA